MVAVCTTAAGLSGVHFGVDDVFATHAVDDGAGRGAAGKGRAWPYRVGLVELGKRMEGVRVLRQVPIANGLDSCFLALRENNLTFVAIPSNAFTNPLSDGKTDGRTDRRTDGRTDDRTDGRKNGRTDGRTDAR